MSFLGLPLAGTMAGGIADLVGKVLDRVIPDPAEAAKAKVQLLDMQQKGELAQLAASTDLMKGQLAVNQAEASSTNFFIAGWRPLVGWTCAFVMAFNYILAPLLTWAVALFGSNIAVPTLDFNSISPVLLGILGLGTMRSIEKIKGVGKGLQ